MPTPDAADLDRLPRSVVPSRYELTIRPDLDAGTFSGAEDVSVIVEQPADRVVLHAADLRIDAARMAFDDGTVLELDSVEYDSIAERASLAFEAPIVAGEWTLHLEFTGSLNDRLRGFYRSTYHDAETGTTRTIAATQFEAADARRAFPCWDEPDRKAVFSITLIVPEGLTAISNGPEIARSSLGDGTDEVRFADTMVMSTYLVAFVVGQLEVGEPLDVDGVPVRIVCVPGKGHLTSFAYEVAAFSLRFFRSYYDIPYPDAKVDMIALPDFASGAMENTGCITYRESLLLVDPTQATQPELENIADVIAHELAHQWFGNLVTMRWWNGIWLNEAFATFMALLTVEAYRPDWERWAAFSRHCTPAKEVDALHTTRAIEYPVHSPDDTADMFDVLTYEKGAAILRMMERYLGAERFQDGIRTYLKAHAYGNTETHDLWDAIEEATGEPVRRIMDQWIWQGGYPLLEVRAAGNSARFEQRRFLADGGTDATVWDVPLRVRELDGDERSLLVPAEGVDLEVTPGAAVVANAGAGAFVRIHYGDELLGRLIARLADLSPVERYGLVDDRWAAVTCGASSAADILTFAQGFADEDDLAVWQVLLQGLGWCDRFVEGEARERFRADVRRLLAPSLDRLGWEAGDGEPDRRRALRGALIQGLAILGADPNAAAMAREYEAEARAGKPVDPALAAASVGVVAFEGGAEEYERHLQLAEGAPTPQEQMRYLYSLPAFTGPDEMDRTLAAVADGTIRTQNGPLVLAVALMNRDQGRRAWTFTKRHWEDLTSAFPPNLAIRITAGLRYLNQPGDAQEAAAFFAEHPIPQSAKGLEQALERQRVAVNLRARASVELAARYGG
jgi:puromycin-sensitive aminopeptidase